MYTIRAFREMIDEKINKFNQQQQHKKKYENPKKKNRMYIKLIFTKEPPAVLVVVPVSKNETFSVKRRKNTAKTFGCVHNLFMKQNDHQREREIERVKEEYKKKT